MRPDDLSRARLLPEQRELLGALAGSELGARFQVAGGTAIAAFYLHHRESEDLDLFSPDAVPLQSVELFLRGLPGVRVMAFQPLYDRRLFRIESAGRSLKVEFTRFPFQALAPVERTQEGLRVASLLDLYVDKLCAAVDRQEPKDDADLYFLMASADLPPLPEALALAERKHSLAGLRYVMQRRLLRVADTLPPTRPALDRAAVVARFRETAEALVARTVTE